MSLVEECPTSFQKVLLMCWSAPLGVEHTACWLNLVQNARQWVETQVRLRPGLTSLTWEPPRINPVFHMSAIQRTTVSWSWLSICLSFPVGHGSLSPFTILVLFLEWFGKTTTSPELSTRPLIMWPEITLAFSEAQLHYYLPGLSIQIFGGQNKGLPETPTPNPWNLWICSFTW